MRCEKDSALLLVGLKKEGANKEPISAESLQRLGKGKGIAITQNLQRGRQPNQRQHRKELSQTSDLQNYKMLDLH